MPVCGFHRALNPLRGDLIVASVSITHHWDTGGCTTFEVYIEAMAYPDAIAEAKATVLAMYRECVGIAEDSSDGQ